MKVIGLIGGVRRESPVPYYRHLNQTMQARSGGLHAAKIVRYGVDFHEVEQLPHAAAWALAA